MSVKKPKSTKANDKKTSTKRKQISQKDVPKYSLEDALKVPAAIFDNYAGDPTEPIDVAAVLKQAPKGSVFKMLTGSSIAYGLIDGGSRSETIKTTSLAERILRSTVPGDDLVAKREAFLLPKINGEFLNKYNGSPIPLETIAINVLDKMGVPRERASEVFKTIVDGARGLGLVSEINGKTYIRIKGTSSPSDTEIPSHGDDSLIEKDEPITQHMEEVVETATDDKIIENSKVDARSRRVFITHGKNKALVAVIKRFLSFGELEPIVSVETETTSIPVPEKVMADMRSCGAAIIHVTDEQTLIDQEGKQQVVLNSNVLIEIGAAMALYGKRFILLVKSGVVLPSNLQGLYRVEYQGDDLGSEGTMKLLSAIDAMKKQPFIPLSEL